MIFGANGDLTKRLIVPALYNLARTGMLPPRMALVGVDHNKKTSEEWTGALKDFLAQVLSKNNEAKWTRGCGSQVARSMNFLSGDFEKPETYSQLKDLLAELRREAVAGRQCAFLHGRRRPLLRHHCRQAGRGGAGGFQEPRAFAA